MSKIIHLVIKGVRGIGMSGELRSIYRTNPPLELPVILTNEDAVKADAAAIGGDWCDTASDIANAFKTVTELDHV